MTGRPTILATRHAIAAGHYLAAEAGFEVLNNGGNAIDAAVAAGLVLGVVQPDIVNVAGVAPIMIWHAERGELLTLDGLGVWPRATDIDVLEREHDGHIPEGVLRTVVPAAPDAWLTALGTFGTMPFRDVAGTAIRLARDGFVVYPFLAQNLATHRGEYARWTENARLFLPGGEPPRVGEIFRQLDLERVLQHMADEERAARGSREEGIRAARRAFYEGDLAATIAGFQAEHGGWLARADLAGFRVRREAPARLDYRGLEVATCGPWCQGPALLEALGILDGFDLAELGHNSASYLHLLTEALDLAFADREAHFGDPAFVDVPIAELLAADYLAARRALISADRAFGEPPPPGDPRSGAAHGGPATAAARGETHSLDTSYLAVVDRWGNAVSATPSDTSYQSPMVPGTGLVPSSRGSQSWGRRDHPSAAAPGKRPRLTPNPAMALERGRPYLVFGTPGGDVQTQAMLQFLLNVHVFGQDLQSAVEAPRVASYNFPSSFEPHEALPGRLMLEGAIDDAEGRTLSLLGHDVDWWPQRAWKAGALCALRIDSEAGVIEAAADPRRPGYALGW